MNNLEWKYVKALEDEDAIEKFEKKYNIQLPDDLKEVFHEHNGGRPRLKLFDTEYATKRVLKTLLSFNDKDIETVHSAYEIMQSDTPNLVPVASDPAGNFICYDTKIEAIVFWQHETAKTERIAESITDFLNHLYTME